MASAKKTAVTALARICVTASLLLPLVSLAANPVAVWDGDFSTLEKNGYTLMLHGNSLNQNNSEIEIDQDIGVRVEADGTFPSGFTVLFKYSDLNLSLADKQTLATSHLTDADDRTGVTINKSGQSCGIWGGGSWTSADATFNSMTSSQASGVLAFSHFSTTSYSGTGTRLYYRGNKYRSDSPFATIMNAGTLGSDSDKNKYKGFSIGGRGSNAEGFDSASGMRITGIAVFSGVLSTSEITDYFFPSEVLRVQVSAGTPVSVSSINTQIAAGNYSVVLVDVADGGTISVDEAFSSAVQIVVSSEGSVTLSAASQPSASYFASVDFSGVEGSLFRSWLPTPGVVGFNFRSANGTDVSGALATADTWIHDNNSASGSSSALFADGLSTLSWSSATTWSCSGSTIISGYLDDGPNGGNGATVTLSGVPYETYDVIVYCSSDSNPGSFLAKTVNGTTYTWNSTTGAAVEGNSSWGKAALSIPVYGVNAMRIKNLTGPLTIYGGARSGDVRGGIAAIQIMPPNTPDNVHVYTLTLDGTATTWTGGNWTIDGNTVDPPVAGLVKIVANASTALTIDTDIVLADLVVTGEVNTVVNIATDGASGSLYSVKTTVAGGVLQQGSAAVLGTTPTVVVEDGATFDLNGLAVSESNAFSIEGAGAGNWPWALTSSGGEFPTGTLRGFTLAGNATIGGANKISLGKTQVGNDLTLNGYTLAKTGSGELYCTNLRFFGGGTLDLQDGTTSFNQWTSLDGSETIDRHTTVIVRSGATLANNTARRLWIDTLDVRGGTVTTTAAGYFGVSSVLTGACETAHLQFNGNATVALSGNLTTTAMECGDISFTKVGGAASVAVTPGTLTSSGAITVGPGVTFNLGTSRPSAVFAVDADATITVRRASAADVPQFYVSSQPANVVLYDETGNVVSDPTIVYDSEKGTLTLVSAGYIWTGASGTWTDSQFDGKPGDTTGFDVSFSQETPAQSAVTVAVSGAKSVNSMSFVAPDTEYTLTGDKITAVGGVDVNSLAAPVAISNAVDGAITINSGATLTLAGTAAVIQDSALSGAGTLVLDPGAGNVYTMSATNTSFTGEAVIKSGTVKMGNATSFGEMNRAASIRVKGGAALDANNTTSGTYLTEKNKVILEEGSKFCTSVDQADVKLSAFTRLSLVGDATVDAPVGTVSISRHFNYNYSHIDLDTNTLTKTGGYDFYVSAVTISGSGTLDVREGALTISSSYEANYNSTMSDGTLRIANGAYLKMVDYTGYKAGGGILTVKNLELDGAVTRDSANYSTLTVTGYATGKGTTPMLTLADGAVLKLSGNGFLKITESLNLPNDTLTIDLSDIDFSTRSSVPLFMVGSAAMLPDSGHIKFVVGSNQVSIPEGWELKLTKNGLGYKLRKTEGFALKLH